jgi:hypothetical protein
MKITERKINELIPAEYNPRQLSNEQAEQLKASLQRFGAVDPAIINTHPERKNIIVGGHQRLKTAQSLGWETFPCVEVELDRDKERELNIRLNKNTGGWDWESLSTYFEVEELTEWGFTDKELFAYSADEFGEDFSLPDGDKEPFQQMTFTLADEQAEQIKNAITDIKATDAYKYCETMGNENSNGNALYLIIMQWAEQRK